MFRRAESQLKFCVGSDFSKQKQSWTHLCLYHTSMGRQRSVSSVYVAGHFSGRGCPAPPGTEKLKSQGLIQFRLEGTSGDHLVQPQVLQFILHRWPFLALEFIHLSSPGPPMSLCLFPQYRFICLRVRCCPSLTRQWNKILPLLFQLWADKGTNFNGLRAGLPLRQVMIFQRGSAEVQRGVSSLQQEEVG